MSSVSFDIASRYLACCSNAAPAKTIKWFMPVPMFMALENTLTQLTCELQSSENSLILSRHKSLWSRVTRQWQKIRGTPEDVLCLDGSLYKIQFCPCTISPQVLTLLNNCTKEKETTWRDTGEPEMDLGDRRKPLPSNVNAWFLTTFHRAQSPWPH